MLCDRMQAEFILLDAKRRFVVGQMDVAAFHAGNDLFHTTAVAGEYFVD